MKTSSQPTVAVLIPCFNEEISVAKVIGDFREQLPCAEIYVFDNRSTDRTAEEARKSGAVVRSEPRQGKGYVTGNMFRTVEADAYVFVDGDDTYPADEVHKLLKPVLEGEADMVTGDRISNSSYSDQNKRPFHQFGNKLVTFLISLLFGVKLKDTMTGYRVFSRGFVKTLPVLSKGFEIEVEMTMTAIHYRYRVCEIPISYRERPEGSFSKLNTFRDGLMILATVFDVFRKYKPLSFFAVISGLFAAAALTTGVPVVFEFWESGLVKKFPRAFLSLGFGIISVILIGLGLTLNSLSRMNQEQMDVLLKTAPARN